MKYAVALNRLCAQCGIALSYTDIWGRRHRVRNRTRRELLEAMGIPAQNEAQLQAALAAREAQPWLNLLPPVLVARSGNQITVPVTVAADDAGQALGWVVILESGVRREGTLVPAELQAEAREVDGARRLRFQLELPDTLPTGYHLLEMANQTVAAAMTLIVAPATCYQPAAVAHEKIWGISIQLYSMRSARNWGIGDLSDLVTALEFAASHGADIVGISPLHALPPGEESPYSPSSRAFFNHLFLAVEAVPDYAESEKAMAAVQAPEFQARLRALRSSDTVEYAKVAEAKAELLALLYQHFREVHLAAGTPRAEAFRAFQATRGPTLRTFALFEALHRHFSGQSPPLGNWHDWPLPYRNPASPEVRAFEADNLAQVEFYEYLQWQMEEQLRAADERARALKLGVGLYHDLAVGTGGSGADVWAGQAYYAAGAVIGAPPDDFNPHGQNWGLAPFAPERLADAAYAPFIAMLRSNMRYAGALRIDHVMALMRLFWVPAGEGAESGGYVSYPVADLMAILALESQRNRCLIIGEDLGTVPDAVRDALDAMGIFSYRVLWFERTADGSFRSPQDYPGQALAAVGTHDLPTLAGFWAGTDLDLRAQLGLFPTEDMRQEQAVTRARDRAQLLVALEREGLLPTGTGLHQVSQTEMTPELMRAVHLYLARSSARILMVQAEDILGQREQMNLPGTDVASYPNWRRKLGLNLEQWFDDSRMPLLAEALNGERRPLTARGPHPPAIARLPRIPVATYRLQLNRNFTLRDATELLPYLHKLGVSHCYLSPLLRARPGSMHGYDIVDHGSFNPELGSSEDFAHFAETLREYGMGLILDVVPNHMGVMGSDNSQWLDVLENGPASRYQSWFDIDWNPVALDKDGKLLVPVLGDHYGATLERGGLRLAFDNAKGEFSIWYGDHRFPVDPREYPRILGRDFEKLSARMGTSLDLLEFQSIVTAFGHLPERRETTPEAMAERDRDKETIKRYLAALCGRSDDIALFVAETIADINGRPGEVPSFDALDALLEAQAYRLAYWRVAADEINYRRFFDINELAGLRQEDPEVFRATHKLVGNLLASGLVDGLRIDHVDGLQDPARYLRQVQALYGGTEHAIDDPLDPGAKPLYVVVEKILSGDERLRANWPVYGTTGYEFANLVNGLFIDPNAERIMSRLYAVFVGDRINFDEALYDAKRLIMDGALASELNVLARQLGRIARADRHTRDYTVNSLRAALRDVAACFPVYRTYITGDGASPEDQRFVRRAVDAARNRSHAADLTVFDFVQEAIIGTLARGREERFQREVIAFAMKFQQLTAPAMAKGLEDTAFYRYQRLISLNDVGNDPRLFGTTLPVFHRENLVRAHRWPYSMITTGTHDSKHSEDVRARINVLSELPEEWRLRVSRWSRLNAGRKRDINGKAAPDRNDEYLLYQTLVGAWPLEQLGPSDLAPFRERIEAYMLKAVREAKRHSSWFNPNAEYEDALLAFIRSLLDLHRSRHFLGDFVPFQQRVARQGMYNSLSQTLIKLTAPGVPDLYQGSESWEFRLVDPDNRAPVNFARRTQALAELAETPPGVALARSLHDAMADGRIKLYLIWMTLNLRQARQDLFRGGEYLPLRTGGKQAGHVCAFARRLGEHMAVTVAPRLLASLNVDAPLGAIWTNTWIEVPAAGRWSNVFTGQAAATEELDGLNVLPAAALLADFPCALLVFVQENKGG